MAAKNITIGIDLGTTNSEIVINLNGKIEIVKNIFGDEYTPSVFGIDKSKNKVVGKRSYERLYKDTSVEEFKNNKAEIKRLMGILETVYFERTNSTMSPEEISSEILKSLKEDVLRKYPDFNVNAAVITVPAYFSVLQAEATKRAGNLAGFKHVVLLQEPIAAAVSHGFMNTKNENWLVYDFGGGTFDVALISAKDGILSVLGHNGDNFLGGKDIDWLIVDKIIAPKILEKYSLNDFNRGSEKYRSIFSKLKYTAETTKIYLSQFDVTSIEIDNIGNDDNAKEIYLSINLTKKEFENLIKDLVDRTIELAKDTLKESGVKSDSVEKIILVGGPTQIPYIKERLERDLGVSVDSSADPLTSIAKGACVFAISQKIPEELMENEQLSIANAKNIKLNYETLTSETEETISGMIESLNDTSVDYYIQIQSDNGLYTGTKLKLKNGKFFDSIVLEPHKENLFWIYLFDDQGNSVPVSPDSFTVTHGLSISGAPIPHSIGIAVAKKDIKSNFAVIEVFERIFEKGSILPLKKTETFKTIRKLKKNEGDNPLWIKVGEGESNLPDRNTFICELGVNGSDLPYDLPEGTEIAITILVNESRELFVTAYIDLIDLTLNARATVRDEVIELSHIETELISQIERANNIAENFTKEEKHKVESIIQSVNSSIQNAHLDEDEKRKANKQLKDLKISLDKLEKEKEMPQLIKEFNFHIDEVKNIIENYADSKEKNINNDQFAKMKSEGEKAIIEKDKNLLTRINEQFQELGSKAYFSNPSTWVHQFKEIAEGDAHFINEKEAEYFIQKGNRAIELGDIDELKRCVRNLMLLMPPEDRKLVENNISGITR